MFSGGEDTELRQIVVTREEVLEFINKLQTNKSPGPDGVYPKVLKELKCEIAHLLTKICNMFLRLFSVPED